MIWGFYILVLVLGAIGGPIGLGLALGFCVLVALSRVHGAITALGERQVISCGRDPIEVRMERPGEEDGR